MKTVIATLKSASPYSQSRAHEEPKLPKEQPDDYDRRTWRSHLHGDGDEVVISAQVWKNAIGDAAQLLGQKIRGRGNNSYTKHFDVGIMVITDARLGIKKSDVSGERLFLNADGKRNGPKRVWRTYPIVHEWKCDVQFIITDETVTEEVFEEHLVACGKWIGIGRWRPRNRGSYGRFEVVGLKWSEE